MSGMEFSKTTPPNFWETCTMRFKVWQEDWTASLSSRKFLSRPLLIKCIVPKTVICPKTIIIPRQRDMIFHFHMLKSYTLASARRLLILLRGIEGIIANAWRL